MAILTLIIANNTAGDITLKDFGSVVVPASNQIDVTGQVRMEEIHSSQEFQDYLDAGQLLINTGA